MGLCARSASIAVGGAGSLPLPTDLPLRRSASSHDGTPTCSMGSWLSFRISLGQTSLRRCYARVVAIWPVAILFLMVLSWLGLRTQPLLSISWVALLKWKSA